MKVKEESEKVSLKLNVQKTKIMASGPITSWEIGGETVETVFWAPKSLQMVTPFSSVQSFSHVRLFATPWTASCQASLSITSSWSYSNSTSIESVMPSNHLILCRPLQSFPASGSFPMSQFFASGGQSIRASASVLPMNIQD